MDSPEYDPFEDEEWLKRTFHALAQSGREVAPDALREFLREFYTKVQDELSRLGIWWSMEELLTKAQNPLVLAGIKSLCSTRGKDLSWEEFVDVISSLEWSGKL